MKLDALREELRRVLQRAYEGRNPRVAIEPDLIEDTLWFLDLLRKREGYDIERPMRRNNYRERDYENPYDVPPFSSSQRYYEGTYSAYTAEDIRRMQEEIHQRFRESDFQSFFRDFFQETHRQQGRKPPSPEQKGKRPWYEVLGLSPDASLAQRQKAYRSLAMRYHPDRKGGSNEKMQELNQAKKEAGI